MKKKLIITIGAVVCTAVLGLGIYQSDASVENPKLSTDDIRQLVKDQYPGTITEMEFEKEHNKVAYEVEVMSNGKEYDLKLDGNTGEILKLKERSVTDKERIVLKENIDSDDNPSKEQKETKNKEDEGKKNNKETPENRESNDDSKKEIAKAEDKKPAKKTVIDSKRAKEIALNEFPGTVTDLELDEDDGRLVYEIEIKSGNEEAEIDIDAYTGEILVIDIDLNDDDDDDNDDD